MEYTSKLEEAKSQKKVNRKLVGKLKKSKPKDLDEITEAAHEEAFEEIDCLKCANCCKTTSPGMNERDVDRLAKYLKLRPAEVVGRYMFVDEDGEYVFKSAPCPFLGRDNYCSVYESRPNACREYPHTNRKRFYQILDQSLRNTEVCPAVVKVFETLRQHY